MEEVKLNVKYGIGSEVYTVKQINFREECPYCKGLGKLNIEGLELMCPNCGGEGYIEISKKKMYVVCDGVAVVKGLKIDVKKNGISYRYRVGTSSGQYKRDNSTLFKTREEAEEYCIKMNKPKKQILLKDIVIPGCFKDTKPNVEKVKEKIDYYNKHGKFDSKIVINKQDILVDGYITYMIAKMYGKELIECYIEDKEIKEF